MLSPSYSSKSEKKVPTKSSMKLIQKAITEIKPNIDSLQEWFDNYLDEHNKIRLSFDIDYLIEYVPKNSKIIEFGSIPLVLTTAIHHLEYEIKGIDIAPERFRNAISFIGLDIIKANVETENIPVESDSFDAALFNEIFEHLRINPIYTMKEVFRVLKPQGILLLSTPNFTSFENLKSLILKGKTLEDIFFEYSKLENLGHMGHVRRYTSIEVGIFLEKIGFEIEEIIYRGTGRKNPIFSWFPRFCPFFSIIAKKPLFKKIV